MEKIDHNFILHRCENINAKTLVFIHGFPDNYHVWNKQIEYFKDKYHLLLIAMPGTLDEPIDKDSYKLNIFCNRIVKAIDQCPSNELIIIGHDMGGAYACFLTYKLNHKKIKLVLVDTMSIGLFRKALSNPKQLIRSSYMLLFQLPVETLVRRIFLPKIVTDPKRPRESIDFNLASLGSYRTLIKGLHDDDQSMYDDVKLLVIWGSKDQFVLPLKESNWHQVSEKIEFKFLDCGHWPMFEAAEDFNEALEEFCENNSN